MTFDSNPFSLTYGKPPFSLIDRPSEIETIINDFSESNPSKMTYMITGLRGTGKTVLLRNISDRLSNLDNWIVVDINPQSDVLSSFSSRLFDQLKKHKLNLDWSISLNLPYISLTFSKSKETITNPELVAEKLVELAEQKNKRILITIDEVNKTNDFKLFVNFYQSLIGKGHLVFMLMTGIRENIDQLISDAAMTFLSRSPKIELGPLGLNEIAYRYRELLSIDDELSIRLARLTNGYAFAYQVLGYFAFKDKIKCIDNSFLVKYDKYLADNGYSTFWKELTNNEKAFCIALADSKNGEVEEIKKLSNLKLSNFNNYRARLLRKEIISSNGYGYLEFTLPRFKEFVLMCKQFGF